MSSRRNAHVTRPAAQQSENANPDEFVNRAQNVSVPLPRTPEQSMPAPETPKKPVQHGNVAPVTHRCLAATK